MANKNKCDLILSGGSSKGPVHVGAIQRYLTNYDPARIVGNSSGAIWGALLATGKTPTEIEKITLETKFDKYVDTDVNPKTLLRLTQKGYISDGVKLKKLFNRLFENKTIGETKIPLWVATTNITKNRLEFFSSESTPDIPISQAVMASSCIPLLFKSVKIDGCLYVDGGMFADFPVDIFEIKSISNCHGAPKGSKDQTLGCIIEGNQAFASVKQSDGIFGWIDALVDTWVEAGIKRSLDNAPKDVIIARTTGLGIDTLNFDLDENTKLSLISEGYSAASKALADAGMSGLKIGKLRKN